MKGWDRKYVEVRRALGLPEQGTLKQTLDRIAALRACEQRERELRSTDDRGICVPCCYCGVMVPLIGGHQCGPKI